MAHYWFLSKVKPSISKDQLFRKAEWRAVDSPKKRTDEFDLFAVKSKKANKTNSTVRFLVESMARQSAYGFIRPLKVISNKIWRFLQILLSFSEYMNFNDI